MESNAKPGRHNRHMRDKKRWGTTDGVLYLSDEKPFLSHNATDYGKSIDSRSRSLRFTISRSSRGAFGVQINARTRDNRPPLEPVWLRLERRNRARRRVWRALAVKSPAAVYERSGNILGIGYVPPLA